MIEQKNKTELQVLHYEIDVIVVFIPVVSGCMG